MSIGLSLLLSRCARKSYRNFPPFPFYLPLRVASIRSPEHTRVQHHRGRIINDEFKGILVTGELRTIGELPQQKQTDAEKCRDWNFQPEQYEDNGNPGNS